MRFFVNFYMSDNKSVLGRLFADLERRLREGESFEQIGLLFKDIELKSVNLESDRNVALVRYLTSKTPVNTKRDKTQDIDFSVWQRGITEPLMKEAGATRSSFFRFVMDQMLDQRPGFRKVPFFYHDFYSEKTVYTPGALELFGIDKESVDKIPLKVLARRFVCEEERKMITDELKSGNRVKDYRLKTSYPSLSEVTVNAYPLIYERRPVGFGVLLYSSASNVHISQTRYSVFEKGVEELIGRIAREFQIIKEESKKLGY